MHLLGLMDLLELRRQMSSTYHQILPQATFICSTDLYLIII